MTAHDNPQWRQRARSAAAPFESLTALREIEGVACLREPLVTFKSVYMGPPHLDRAGAISSVPSLSRQAGSFLRLICEGNLPPPPFPECFARGRGFPHR